MSVMLVKVEFIMNFIISINEQMVKTIYYSYILVIYMFSFIYSMMNCFLEMGSFIIPTASVYHSLCFALGICSMGI